MRGAQTVSNKKKASPPPVDNVVTVKHTEREFRPDRGEVPGPDEMGFVRCKNGHLGPFMTIEEDVEFEGPKGPYSPYCLSCVNLYVIRMAGLTPAKFYARKQIIRPASNLILPGDVRLDGGRR